jgi:hypothetical protein
LQKSRNERAEISGITFKSEEARGYGPKLTLVNQKKRGAISTIARIM